MSFLQTLLDLRQRLFKEPSVSTTTKPETTSSSTIRKTSTTNHPSPFDNQSTTNPQDADAIDSRTECETANTTPRTLQPSNLCQTPQTKHHSRNNSRNKATTPSLQSEIETEPLSSGEPVWVTQGKMEHMAIVVDYTSNKAELLVRWTSNNLTECVPMASVKPVTNQRQSRQRRQLQKPAFVQRKRKRLAAAATKAKPKQKTTRESSVSPKHHPIENNCDESLGNERMDVVSMDIRNAIQDMDLTPNGFPLDEGATEHRSVTTPAPEDVIVGLELNHKVFAKMMHHFQTIQCERREMTYRRTLVIASQLYDFVFCKRGIRFWRKRDDRHKEANPHEWIVLQRHEATRIIRQSLFQSKNRPPSKRKRPNQTATEFVTGSQPNCSSQAADCTFPQESTDETRSDLEISLFPTSLDVLCGEISPLDMPNTGNFWLLSQISAFSKAYEASTCGAEKAKIARRILAAVWHKGGRFIVPKTRDGRPTGEWKEMQVTDAVLEIRRAFLYLKQGSGSEVRLV